MKLWGLWYSKRKAVMSYKIVILKNVVKFLETCDKKIAHAFFEKTEIIAQNPSDAYKKVDVKAIKWENTMYRLRIGGYRFLYVVENQECVILFVKADSRGGIYK